MAIVLEGTVKLGQPGADPTNLRTSLCQVLSNFSVQTTPNARGISANLACYVDRAAYETGKNPMDGGNGVQASLGGEKLDTVFPSLETATMQAFADYLLTTEQFGGAV